MSQQICGAKIRPFAPRNHIELTCGLGAPDHVEPYTEHMAVLHDYAFPGSMTEIRWREDDRRTFRGDWQSCPSDCIFPFMHEGECSP